MCAHVAPHFRPLRLRIHGGRTRPYEECTRGCFTAVEQINWPVGLTSSYIIEVVVCLIPKEIVKFIHN